MKRKVMLLWLPVILLTCCKTIPKGLAAPTAKTLDKPLGFCVFWKSAESDIPGIAASGGGWLRLDFKWDSIETESGVMDFTYYDKLVELAEKRNVRIIGLLNGDARWIHRDGKIKGFVPPSRIPDFCRFTEAVARRYGNRIAVWEIWNEPNTPHWKGTRNQYFRLLNAAMETLEETLENPYISSPGFFWGDTLFMKQLLRNVSMDKLDALSFHPYGVSAEASAIQIIKVIKAARKEGFRGDFIVSEVGFPIGGLYPSRIPEKKGSDTVIKTIGYALSLDITTLTWYKFSDSRNRRIWNSEDWFGLTFREEPDSGGEGIKAYRFLTGYINGSDIDPYMVNPGELSGFYQISFVKNNTLLVLFWGKKGTRITITAPDGTMHGSSERLDDPEPLPDNGKIKLTGLAEFLIVPVSGIQKPAVTFSPSQK